MAPTNIFVINNDQKHGPYTLEEVQIRLQSKQFHPHNLAWYEGITDWLPLAQLINLPIDPVTRPRRRRRRKSPGFSRASFLIAIIGLGLWVIVFFPAVAINSGSPSANSPAAMVIGFLNYVTMAANVAGLLLAGVAFNRPHSNQSMALYGAMLNSLEILFGIFLFLLV